MILDIKTNPRNWKKECWIASKEKITYDEEGNEILVYGKPIKFEFNYQPINSKADLMEFGEKASIMQKAVIIKEGDTPEILQKRVMEQAEWKILPLSLKKVCAMILKGEMK